MGLARRLGCAPRTGTTAGPDTRPAASAGHSGAEVSSSGEPPSLISPRRCRWARGQALTPQEVSRGCWHPRHGHSASWVALVAPCNARSRPRGGDEAARCALPRWGPRWSRGRGHPADILGTSRGHPGDIHQLLLLAALQQSLPPGCSHRDPALEVPPLRPDLPKMPPGKGPQGFPALPLPGGPWGTCTRCSPGTHRPGWGRGWGWARGARRRRPGC